MRWLELSYPTQTSQSVGRSTAPLPLLTPMMGRRSRISKEYQSCALYLPSDNDVLLTIVHKRLGVSDIGSVIVGADANALDALA